MHKTYPGRVNSPLTSPKNTHTHNCGGCKSGNDVASAIRAPAAGRNYSYDRRRVSRGDGGYVFLMQANFVLTRPKFWTGVSREEEGGDEEKRLVSYGTRMGELYRGLI